MDRGGHLLRLIINADDLGASVAVNDAIATGVSEGWITSASLLTVGPAVDHALRLGLPDVGIHLAATGFPPLTDLPARLRAPDGTMAAPLHPSVDDVVAIAAEWRAQIAAAPFRPSHLDTHEHLHFQPQWSALVRRLAEAMDLPMRRPGIYTPRGRISLKALVRRRLAPIVRGPDHFGAATALRRARGLAGVVEMMLHPGNTAAPRYAEEVAWVRAGRPGFPPADLVDWSVV